MRGTGWEERVWRWEGGCVRSGCGAGLPERHGRLHQCVRCAHRRTEVIPHI